MTSAKNANKRLFIFAAYDKDCLVDDSLLYYLRELSKLGDIIFTMDNKTANSEIYKVSQIPNVLHAVAQRHGEYDFGSYKRGYQWAYDNDILKNYDWIYLVNDSVFGPLFDLGPVLSEMESKNPGSAFGMIGLHSTPERLSEYPDHVQSWFVGMAAKICQQPWFAEFINSVEHLDSKDDIVWRYEVGLSRLLNTHGIEIDRVEKTLSGCVIYSEMISSLPFLKKLAIDHIKDKSKLKKIEPIELRNVIFASIKRLGLDRPIFRPLWKIKLFNRITFLSWERHKNGHEYRLRIFKIIPIRFLKYKGQ